MARKKKRKSNNPDGRPSRGLDEVRLLVPMPQELADAATTEAADEGVSRAEWIRSAMRARLRTAADA